MGSHRIHRIHRSLLLRRNSHRFHSQGVHLSPLGFAACQSKKCTNRTDCFYFVGAPVSTAPTELIVFILLVHLRQVHPLKLLFHNLVRASVELHDVRTALNVAERCAYACAIERVYAISNERCVVLNAVDASRIALTVDFDGSNL